METFNYPLNASDISNDFQSMWNPSTTLSANFANDHVQLPTVTASISGPASALMAILINSTEFASAVWVPFEASPTITLGSTDGDYDVWLGVQGISGQTYWTRRRLTLDRVPPTVYVTNQTTSSTSRPIIQLQGYSPESLASVSYTLANANGTISDEPGILTDQQYDPNTLKLTTTSFQCFDLELAIGENTVTLKVQDLAGNITITALQYTLDLSTDTTAPAITLYWPQDGMQLSGSAFTLRGLVDDPTATVAVSGLTTDPVEGVVERNGAFWIEELPLTDGNNSLTVTVTDAAGNVATTSLTVVKSNVQLTMDPLDPNELIKPSTTVTGTINDPGYAVWVNGVRAGTPVFNGTTYDWTATAVPVYGEGTAVMLARAIPNSDNDGNGTASNSQSSANNPNLGNPMSAQAKDLQNAVEQPPRVYVQQFTDTWGAVYDATHSESSSTDWTDGAGGTGTVVVNHPEGVCTTTKTWDEDFYPPTKDGTAMTGCDPGPPPSSSAPTDPPEITVEYCDVNENAGAYSRNTRSIVMLKTGGKGVAKRQNLFTINASAWEILQKQCRPGWGNRNNCDWTGIPPGEIKLAGFGRVGNDGNLYKVLPTIPLL